MNAENEGQANVSPDEWVVIPQDENRGPGWFLIVSYVLITLSCLIYLFTHWNWRSDYEMEQARHDEQIATVQ